MCSDLHPPKLSILICFDVVNKNKKLDTRLVTFCSLAQFCVASAAKVIVRYLKPCRDILSIKLHVLPLVRIRSFSGERKWTGLEIMHITEPSFPAVKRPLFSRDVVNVVRRFVLLAHCTNASPLTFIEIDSNFQDCPPELPLDWFSILGSCHLWVHCATMPFPATAPTHLLDLWNRWRIFGVGM